MTEVPAELARWVRDNHCSYDIAPIVELQRGEQADVGYEINLHAELPWEGETTPEILAKQDEIRDKLAELIDVLIPKESADARFDFVPFRLQARFLRGAGFPTIKRTVRVFRRDYQHVTPEDRGKFRPFEKELDAIGFKKA